MEKSFHDCYQSIDFLKIRWVKPRVHSIQHVVTPSSSHYHQSRDVHLTTFCPKLRISTLPSDSNARHINLNHSVNWCLTQHPGMREDAQPWQPQKRSTMLVKNVRWQLWRAAQSRSAIQTPSKQRKQQVQSCEMGMRMLMQEQGGQRRPERPGASPSPSPSLGLQILSATLKLVDRLSKTSVVPLEMGPYPLRLISTPFVDVEVSGVLRLWYMVVGVFRGIFFCALNV